MNKESSPALSGFHYHIDEPSSTVLENGNITFRGWVFARNPARKIEFLRVRLGHKQFLGSFLSQRGDVAQAFPFFPEALTSGFHFLLSLPSGAHDLHLEALLAGGEWETVGVHSVVISAVSNAVPENVLHGGVPIDDTKKALHIAIDGRVLHRKTTGTERYINNIIRHLLRLPEASGLIVDLLVWNGVPWAVPGVRYIIDRHLDAIRMADVFFKTFPSPEDVYLQEMALAQRCVFLPHDLIACSHPEYMPSLAVSIAYWRHLHTAFLLSTRVIAISAHNRRDMQERMRLPAHLLETILHGAEVRPRLPSPVGLDRYGLTRDGYIIAIGTNYPHKNLRNLVDAFTSIRTGRGFGYKLVLVGMPYFAAGQDTVPEGVVQLNHVSDADLDALLGGARALIYPSLYEGFGLPPLEAMAAGVPVAASDATSIPEVCGDAALYFNGHEVAQIATALERIANEENLRYRLIAAGAQRCTAFPWKDTARKTLNCLTNAVSCPPHRLRSQLLLERHQSGFLFENLLVMVTHVKIARASAGNEVRILKFIRHLRKRGFRVALIYTPLDRVPLTLAERYESVSAVDFFFEVSDKLPVGFIKNVDEKILNAVAPLPKWQAEERSFVPDITVAAVAEVLDQLKPRVVIAEYIWTSRILQMVPPGVLRVIDTHDKFSNKAAQVNSYGIEDVLAMSEADEKAFLDRADLILAIQPEEAAKFAALGSRAKVITVGCDMEVGGDDCCDNSKVVLIVGSDNQINVRFVTSFVKNLWPKVYEQVPDSRLRIVGKVGRALASVQVAGVDICGVVDDLDKAYAAASLVVNPVAAGTGLKIKTIEALAHGKALICASEGAAGLPMYEQAYLQVAQTDAEWCDMTVKFLRDEIAREKLAARALAFAQENLTADCVYRDFITELSTRGILGDVDCIQED